MMDERAVALKFRELHFLGAEFGDDRLARCFFNGVPQGLAQLADGLNENFFLLPVCFEFLKTFAG